MIKKHFSAVILLIGIFLTQIFATVHVYLSNQNIYLKMTKIGDAGFFTVPNTFIIETLTHFKYAFCGGVFFTLTIGATVSVVSLLMVRAQGMFFFKKRYLFLCFFVILLCVVMFLKISGVHPFSNLSFSVLHVLITMISLSVVSFLLVWVRSMFFSWKHYLFFILFIMILSIVVLLNKNGFNPFPTLYFSITPVLIVLISFRLLPTAEGVKDSREGMLFKILMHGIPVLVLILLWGTQYNRGLFINLRDSLLLTNPVGNVVNDFYYKYTLYPAEIIKPIHQKTLKTYQFETVDNPKLINALEKKLMMYDYLNIKDSVNPDITLRFDSGQTLLNINGKTVLQVDDQSFLENPAMYLKEFSRATDRNGFFRKTILVSLLFGFPIGLYILVFHLFYFISGLLVNEKGARISASGLCFFIGLYFLVSVYHLNSVLVTTENLNDHMISDKWQERVAALKYIRNEKIEITTFQSLEKKLTSRYIAERYWLATALGESRSKRADLYLARLLNDSSPNVICQVFHALGMRKHKDSISLMKGKIKASTHWYDQWYGYGSLRKLGWRQRNKSE